MLWQPLGDAAWLLETNGSDASEMLSLALAWAAHLEAARHPRVHDVVVSYASVAVHCHPADAAEVEAWLAGLGDPGSAGRRADARAPVEIPVCYGGVHGPDLDAVAAALGMNAATVAGLHASAEYTVAAVGFSPGFPYLAGLPDALSLPRLASPRPVAAGSVAIAGGQAGVYPFDSPGGWHVLGKTSRTFFDPTLASPSLLRAGDHVRFVPVAALDIESTEATGPAPVAASGGLEVLAPGGLTSVQDLGRPGFQASGVSPGGAADPVAARIANRLLGNPDHAAVLECCLRGPVLRFHEACRVATVGWRAGWSGKVMDIPADGLLDLGQPTAAVRAYVAVAGGFAVPAVLGSRSTDLRAHLGGHAGRLLRAGDRLPIGSPCPGPRPGHWKVAWPAAPARGQPVDLRFLRGLQADWFTLEAWDNFCTSHFHLSPRADRMGARFDGPALRRSRDGELVSQPVVAGSIQVPPDGQPIVLLAERQTIGGYPQIGYVISADLPLLARAWPGTAVRFREVSLPEARAAWRASEQSLARLQAGLDLLP